MTAFVQCTEVEFINTIKTFHPDVIYRSRREYWENYDGHTKFQGLDKCLERSAIDLYGTEEHYRAYYDIVIGEDFFGGIKDPEPSEEKVAHALWIQTQTHKDKSFAGFELFQESTQIASTHKRSENFRLPMTFITYGFVHDETAFVYKFKVYPHLVFKRRMPAEYRTEVKTKTVRRRIKKKTVVERINKKIRKERHIYDWELPKDEDFVLPFPDILIVEGELSEG